MFYFYNLQPGFYGYLCRFKQPQMEECAHSDTTDGACTSCGLCLSFDENYTATYAPQFFIAPNKMKYAVMDEARKYDKHIESLSSILGVSGYSKEVRGLLLEKKFEYKTGVSDKVLSTMYYVLKKNRYPISYSDILPYTEKSASGFKRIVLREFQYNEVSAEYLENVFNRVRDFYSLHGLRKEVCLSDFISIARRYRCTSPQALCAAYFIKDQDVSSSYERYNLGELISIGLLKHAVRNIKMDQRPEDLLDTDKESRFVRRNPKIESSVKKYFMNRLWRKAP